MRKIAILIMIVIVVFIGARTLGTRSSIAIANGNIEQTKQIVDFQESQSTQATAENDPTKVKKLVPAAAAAIHDLGSCLKKNLCGEKETPGRAYFDPENTESNRKLNRALRFTLTMEGKANGADFPKKEDLLPLLTLKNEETPVLALEILLTENKASCEEILSEVTNAEGRSLPLVFSTLFKSSCDRVSILNSLSNALKNNGADTLQAIAKEIPDFNLTQREFAQIAPNFCRLQNSPTNWPQLKHQLTTVIESQGFNLSVKQICSST